MKPLGGKIGRGSVIVVYSLYPLHILIVALESRNEGEQKIINEMAHRATYIL